MEFDPQAVTAWAREQERQFALRARHPERDAIYADYAARSERFRNGSPGWRNLPYGTSERCAIDWFPPEVPAADGGPAPLLVFIHGGFWRALDRRIFSFVAEHYRRRGVAVALLGYELAPRVRVGEIVDQVKEAMRHLNARADALAFDRARVSIAGHSAGAHLSAMIASCPPDEVGGRPLVSLIPISGVFALEPLLLTSVNHDVRMTPDEAIAMSPAYRTTFHCGRFLLPVGGLETDGFLGQSRDFERVLRGLGHDATLMIVPDRTHFDILENFSRPEDALFRATLDAIHGRRIAVDESLNASEPASAAA